MKRNKNFWSYRLHKLGTPKVFQTDRRSGPITRPAFAKGKQVKIIGLLTQFILDTSK